MVPGPVVSCYLQNEEGEELPLALVVGPAHRDAEGSLQGYSNADNVFDIMGALVSGCTSIRCHAQGSDGCALGRHACVDGKATYGPAH